MSLIGLSFTTFIFSTFAGRICLVVYGNIPGNFRTAALFLFLIFIRARDCTGMVDLYSSKFKMEM
ncbi:hypothetical protein GcM3_02700 [Golovinomyces cichoracearum]|uniref:Uncharacterized protein n=1 Tax=Golovinomyces cichoracearum TaxID=62708 RepID=A0A420HJF1_9PEZI|nr:hypothetical protein GcM3_02700 [Golovinomyces cichoracearum]